MKFRTHLPTHTSRALQRHRRKGRKHHGSHSVDVKKLLHFSQQLYAHALTLQAVIRNDGQDTYDALRPKYDRQAAEQFKIFLPHISRTS